MSDQASEMDIEDQLLNDLPPRDSTVATRINFPLKQENFSIFVTNPGPFDVSNPTKWKRYLQSMKIYFSSNGVNLLPPDRQRDIFIGVAGEDVIDRINGLLHPKTFEDVSLKEIEDALSKSFMPKESVIINRFNFLNRGQNEDESITDFAAALRKLSNCCKFDTMLDSLLRDKFVVGLNDSSIRERLFQQRDNLPFDEAIEIATSYELAVKRSRHVTFSASNKEVHKVSNAKLSSAYKCFSCGANHLRSSCPHLKSKCHSCGLEGHIAKVCKKKPSNFKPNSRSRSHSRPNNRSARSHSNDVQNSIHTLNQVSSSNSRYWANISINSLKIKMEIDSGSPVSIISEYFYNKINSIHFLQLERYEGMLKGISNVMVDTLGKCFVNVRYNNKTFHNLPLIILSGDGPNLLGRNWFSTLGISVNGVHFQEVDSSMDDLIVEFKDIFIGLGKYNGKPLDLPLDPDCKPIFFKPRRVPLGIKPKIDEALDNLISQGILEAVASSNWGTPIVPVMKPDGSVRVCSDYKITLNKAVKPHPHPVPIISHLLSSIGNVQFFARLDLAQAYHQIPVSEDLAMAQTIVTHRGAFKVNRLQFGISTAAGYFQALIEDVLKGLEGVYPYFDDIFIAANSKQELVCRLREVFNRFRKFNLRLKKEKCEFCLPEIDFLGFRITKEGIRPSVKKWEAIQRAPEPKNKKDLQAFLGLVNFYHSFLKGKASIAEPLHRLLDHKCAWEWTKIHKESFSKIKKLLSSDSLLVHFDINKPIILVCDASPFGIGAVLAHKLPDGSEAPIAFYSRTLTSTERNYAQIDREALGIISGVKKFHHYLYGLKFSIHTDHKPLLRLFDPYKPTADILSPRMLRWSILLNAYNYSIVHKPGKSISHADALSRCPVPVAYKDSSTLKEIQLLDENLNGPLSAENIKDYTSRDPILSKVRMFAIKGWPYHKVPTELRPYKSCKDSITVYQDCVLRGNRVVVPEKLRDKILNSLHFAHPGMVKMKALARSYVWWPKINSDIEAFVRKCLPCQSFHKADPAEKDNSWPISKVAWQRLNIDHAGPFHGKLFFIIVDSYSRWLHVDIVPSLSSKIAISRLRSLFSTHGLPETIVSDNGTCFTSEEFKEFCKGNAIEHKLIAPFHPSSNGRAERMVQFTKLTLKKFIMSANSNNSNLDTALSKFLLCQHITPTLEGGKSPSELLFNRKLRTTLDALKPKMNVPSNIQAKRQFSVGNYVFVRNFSKGVDWIPGKVLSRSSSVNYEVLLEDGRMVSRHVDQMRSNSEKVFRETTSVLPSHSQLEETYSAPEVSCSSNQASDSFLEDTSHSSNVPFEEIPSNSLVSPTENQSSSNSLGIPPEEIANSNDLNANLPVSEIIENSSINPEFSDQLNATNISPIPPPRLRRKNVRIFNDQFVTGRW